MADLDKGVGFDLVMGGGSHNRADGRTSQPRGCEIRPPSPNRVIIPFVQIKQSTVNVCGA